MKQEPTSIKSSNSSTTCNSTGINVAILDSGGWTLKYGLTQTQIQTQSNDPAPAVDCDHNDDADADADDDTNYRKIPNVTAKLKHHISLLVGDELHSVKNKGKLVFQRPLERGYCTDWGTQLSVWSRALLTHPVSPLLMTPRHALMSAGGVSGKKRKVASSSSVMVSVPQSLPSVSNTCCFILTQPFTPTTIYESMEEIVFKDLGFGSIMCRLGVCMAAYRYNKEKQSRLEKEGRSAYRPISSIDMLHDTTIEDSSKCCLVIDSGFSCTHIVPTYNGMAMSKGIRRVNVGGKLLTNHLKEVVSYRQWNMMDEYVLINDAKEKLCYVSTSFENDLKRARGKRVNDFDRDFVLPNFVDSFEGTVQIPFALQKTMLRDGVDISIHIPSKEIINQVTDEETSEEIKGEDTNIAVTDNDEPINSMEYDSDEETPEQRLARIRKQKMEEIRRREIELRERQSVSLSVERFAVPEVLFRPKDIGLNQAGLCYAIMQSVESSDEKFRAALYRNILLIGGNTELPFYRDRIEKELRSIVASQYAVRVQLPHDSDPIGYSWNGAKDYINSISGTDLLPLCKDRMSWEKRKSVQYTFDPRLEEMV